MDVDLLARPERRDGAAAISVGAVDPVVQAPTQPVDAVLRIALDETAIEHFAPIRLAISVGVFRVQDVGRTCDQHAVAPWHHTQGMIEIVDKDLGSIILPVAVLVLQVLDASPRDRAAVATLRIVAHLHNPQAAVGIPVNRDGIHDERFRTNQLHAESWADLKTVPGLRRALRLELGEDLPERRIFGVAQWRKRRE